MQTIIKLVRELACDLSEIRDFGAQIDDTVAAEMFLHGAFRNRCPRCDAPECSATGQREVTCVKCKKKHSLTAASPIAGTKISIRIWLAAVWHIFVDERTMSARGFGRRYEIDKMTAWALMKRVRGALPSVELSGEGAVKGQILGKESATNFAEICVAVQDSEIKIVDERNAPTILGGGANANSLFFGRVKAWLSTHFHGVSARYLWLYLAEFAHRYGARRDARRKDHTSVRVGA